MFHEGFLLIFILGFYTVLYIVLKKQARNTPLTWVATHRNSNTPHSQPTAAVARGSTVSSEKTSSETLGWHPAGGVTALTAVLRFREPPAESPKQERSPRSHTARTDTQAEPRLHGAFGTACWIRGGLYSSYQRFVYPRRDALRLEAKMTYIILSTLESFGVTFL